MNQKQYEHKDHLGNVRVTFSDLKQPQDCDLLADGYVATAMSVNNYYSFGMLQPGRNWSVGNYRWGMNGQENDNEITGITGTHTTATFWEYDTRLGRRWNLDPKPTVGISDYACFGNNPIWFSDVNGDKWKDPKDETEATETNIALEARKNSLISKSERFSKKSDKFSKKGDETMAAYYKEQAAEAMDGANDMAKAQQELTEMGSDPNTIFTFKRNSTSAVHYTYMDESGVVVMEFGSMYHKVHELKHGFQHLTGEVELIPGAMGGKYVDATDEQAAYQRQYYFNPVSVRRLNYDTPLIITRASDISVDFVLSLYRISNTGSVIYEYKGLSRESKNKPAGK
jgi:hypothetical protein